MEAAQSRETLERQICFLHGGVDRAGSPVIIFPAPGDWIEYSLNEVSSTLRYLTSLPDSKFCQKLFTVIVDMRHASIKYLKTVLRAIQLTISTLVKHVLIIKPEQFLGKSKLELDLRLEVYDFKLLLVSISKLSKFVDISQLPPTLSGTFSYDHCKWLDLRLRYECFIRDANAFLKRVELLLESVAEGTEDTAGSGMKGQKKQLYLQTEGKELTTRGTVLSEDLKRDSNLGFYSSNINANCAGRVDSICETIQKLDGAHTEKVQKKSKEKSDVVLYDQFMSGVDNLSDWFLGPGEKWLVTLHEIGDNRDEAEQLKREHEQLRDKSQEVMEKSDELCSLGEQLITAGHPASEEIRKRSRYMTSITSAFADQVQRQSAVIQYSVEFHQLVDEFGRKLDSVVEVICTEVEAGDEESLQEVVRDLDERMDEINKLCEEVHARGEHFVDHLRSRERDLRGGEVLRDYMPGIVSVKQVLADIDDRKFRCSELADVRRLKMQQLLQLYISERDANQAIIWIKDLSVTLATQNCRIGSEVEDVELLRRDHKKLEETGRSTFEYGRELCQVALVLRRSCRMDISSHHRLVAELDHAWAQFCRALSEQAARLNISWAFHSTVRQVAGRLEDLCVTVESTRSTENSMLLSNRRSLPPATDIANVRRKLREDIRELKHMGEALISRAHQPLLPANEIGLTPKEDKVSIDEIRRKLSALETRQETLESSWEPLNSLVRRLTLQEVHDSLRFASTSSAGATAGSSHDSDPFAAEKTLPTSRYLPSRIKPIPTTVPRYSPNTYRRATTVGTSRGNVASSIPGSPMANYRATSGSIHSLAGSGVFGSPPRRERGAGADAANNMYSSERGVAQYGISRRNNDHYSSTMNMPHSSFYETTAVASPYASSTLFRRAMTPPPPKPVRSFSPPPTLYSLSNLSSTNSPASFYK